MSVQSIEAIIFDMDGLLLDSEVYWERARRDYCRSVGCDWTADDELSVKGANSPEWAERIRERCSVAVPAQDIIDGVTARMETFYDENLPLLPGAVDTVRALASRFPMAVASSSPPTLIDHVLREADIRACFADVVSADTVGKGKPNPDVFLVAADQLGKSPNRCAVFEDSTAGISAALAAGAFVIAVPNPHYPPSDDVLSRADLVLGSLTEFRPEMLKG